MKRPVAPVEPDPDSCCGNGCASCVWDVYYDKLERYELRLTQWEENEAAGSAEQKEPIRKVRRTMSEMVDEPRMQIGRYISDWVNSKYFSHYPLQPIRDARVHFSRIMYQKKEKNEAERCVMEVTFDVDGRFDVKPWDTVHVLSPNRFDHVTRLIERLKLAPQMRLSILDEGSAKPCPHIPPGSTIEQIFSVYSDVESVISKEFLSVLSIYCSDSSDETWLRDAAEARYESWIVQKRRTLFHVLSLCPSCTPPLSQILWHLPAKRGRQYSICSHSNTSDTTRLTVCLSLRRTSVTIGVDEEHLSSVSDYVYDVVTSGGETMRLTSTYSETRRRADECLYREEIEDYHNRGIIERVRTAVSRPEGGRGRRVQDLMREDAASICRCMMQDDAVVYLCGEVEEVLKQLNPIPEEAEELIKSWKRERRIDPKQGAKAMFATRCIFQKLNYPRQER
ncbi:putative NADPH--cytochrome P450 [Planoprotostelium fungivorum]|uniref:NADPH--hemoprotein reductase n=1 Tax=Planoprotostelium fungivorum TaxID=1890364 RepID=A0A2P6NAS3_9EUKA|nr:putative NADPH--cytochrome P450 [Planoprotostelium fungivorum]